VWEVLIDFFQIGSDGASSIFAGIGTSEKIFFDAKMLKTMSPPHNLDNAL